MISSPFGKLIEALALVDLQRALKNKIPLSLSSLISATRAQHASPDSPLDWDCDWRQEGTQVQSQDWGIRLFTKFTESEVKQWVLRIPKLLYILISLLRRAVHHIKSTRVYTEITWVSLAIRLFLSMIFSSRSLTKSVRDRSASTLMISALDSRRSGSPYSLSSHGCWLTELSWRGVSMGSWELHVMKLRLRRPFGGIAFVREYKYLEFPLKKHSLWNFWSQVFCAKKFLVLHSVAEVKVALDL